MAKEKKEKAPAADAGDAPAVAEKKKGRAEGGAAETGVGEAAPKAPKPKKAKPEAEAGDEGRRKKRGRPMRKLGKKQKANLSKRPENAVSIDDAVKLLHDMGKGRKFDQSVNIVMHLGIDPKHADQMIRGAISLPKGIGKSRRVIAFAEGEEADKAKAAGAIEVGVDDLINKVSGGWSDFDVAVAHARLMGKVGKLGKVLGPAGKMPSPKNGTVTNDVALAVKEFSAGKSEFRNDTGGNVHGVVGKISFSASDLKENIEAFIEHIRRLKPASSKGHYIKRVCVSGTMTPSIDLAIAQ